MKKNTWIIIAIVILAIIIIAYLFAKGKNIAPANVNQNESASCSDPTCLLPYFINCQAGEMNMPFDSGIYTIKVLGLEDEKCHYQVAIKDNTGALLAPGLECRVPKEMITNDRFDHLFGGDKVAGKEAILTEQNQIDQNYCLPQS